MWSNEPIVNDEYNNELIKFKLGLKKDYKIYYPVELENIYKEYIDFIKTNKSNKKLVDLINNKPEQEKFFLGWFRRALEV